MSQYPPYPQDPNNPAPYGTPGYGPGPAKPGSITFLAVVAIVFGGLGSLCTGFGTVVGLMQLAGVSLISGPAGQMRFSPGVQAFGVFDSVLELALYVTLLFIGISALSLKPWARRAATTWWSVVMIIWALVRLVAQIIWVGPASLQAAQQMQQPSPGLNPAQMHTMMNGILIGGAIVTLLIQLLPAVLFLLLWRSPAVVGAFEGTVPPGTGTPNPYGT